MELLRQNIRKICVEREGQMQIILEEDVNLPETKPDVNVICFEKGRIEIEDVRPMADAASVRGKLMFSVLYDTLEYGGRLECMEGKIPFEEKIRMDGLQTTDSVSVTGRVEDLTISMINSRKLSVQSVVTLEAVTEVLRDESVPVGTSGDGTQQESVQVRLVPMRFTEVCLCKDDALRVKETLSLPSGYPNVGRILWKSVDLGEMNFRLGEERLYVQGEIRVFVLYEGADGSAQTYETVTNVSSELACPNAGEGDALDVRYGISQWELAPRPDPDGEMRDLGLELTLELRICVYEDRELGVVTDVYGVSSEVLEEKKTVGLRHLLRSVTGKTKVSDHLKLEGGEKSLQLVRGEAEMGTVESMATEDGITIRGSLGVRILYATGEEENPYGCLRKRIPFEYSIEIPGMAGGEAPRQVQAQIEQFNVTLLDGEEVDVKAILCFSACVFQEKDVRVLGEIKEMPLDPEKMASLPGMVIYVVQPGDHLWNVGKRYYVPVQSLMDFNGLSGEELTPGQKLLIVKGNGA